MLTSAIKIHSMESKKDQSLKKDEAEKIPLFTLKLQVKVVRQWFAFMQIASRFFLSFLKETKLRSVSSRCKHY